MFLRQFLGQLVIVSLAIAMGSPSLFAQRYLTEFVGTSTLSSNATAVQLSTNLAFDALDNRRLDGLVSLSSALNSSSDLFAVQGTLASSGNCNVQLRNTTTSGGLNLVEIPFDDNSFALIGNLNANIGGDKLLAAGKYRGTTAVMRPVADPVLISDSIMVIAVSRLVTGQQSDHPLAFTEILDSLSFSGQFQLYDAGGKLQDFGQIVGGPPAVH